MEIQSVTGNLSSQSCSVITLCLFAGNGALSGQALDIDKKLSGKLSEIIKSGEFTGKKNQITVVHIFGELAAKRVILAGVGKKDKCKPEVIRGLMASVAKSVTKMKCESFAVSYDSFKECDCNVEPAQFSRSVTEGVRLGLYKFDHYKTKNDDKDKNELKTLLITAEQSDLKDSLDQGISEGQEIATAVCNSRDLSNHPSNFMTPSKLAATALKWGKKSGVTTSILELKDIEKLGMGAYLSVAKGSVEPLKFIKMEYKPENKVNSRPISLVGKAITFDSGGISLKSSENMHQMKDDMSGGGAVISAINAIAKLKLPVYVNAYVPACENMPGGRASKPGDVVTTMSGQTIEIQNTDAEGRLILADAIFYASEQDPELIIDIATLTGACVVALGSVTTGLMGNDEELIVKMKKAGQTSGERIWEMPMFDEYREQMDSDVADIRNVGGRGAGTITAAKFLEDFTGDSKWMHIDIAGTSWSNKCSGITSKGATGAGVSLLIQFIKNYGESQ